MSFAAPAFLWGLTALAIPIAVHLFNFRRYRKVYFSNVDRLAAMQQQSQRQSQLRERLLLAARLLAITCLVLAFARPVVGSTERSLDGAAVSIYVDNSFSMESLSTDADLLSEAVARAAEIASAYSADTRFQLLTADLDAAQMQWLARNELLDALARIQPSPAAPQLSSVAAMQQRLLAQSGAPARHAYLISDFQKSVSDIAACQPSPDSIQWTLIPLASTATDNICIDTVVLDAPAYLRGSRATAEVTLRNDGNTDMEKVPVRLMVGSRERAVATVDIAAGATVKAVMPFPLDTAGWLDIAVTVDDYPVSFDNSYYLTLHTGEPVRALELYATSPNPHLGRLFYDDPAIEYTVAKAFPLLADYHFVVLNGISALPSGDASQLAAWVAEGGSMLVVPPEGPASVEQLNSLLASLGVPQLGQWLVRHMKASTVDLENGLFRGVFNGTTRDMEMPSTEAHYSLSASPSALVTLADGDPLLTLSTSGQGRVYLMLTPLDSRWTDFVSQALFVPTFYNMALFSRPLPPTSYTIDYSGPIMLAGSYNPDLAPPHLVAADHGDQRSASDYDCIADLRELGGRQVMFTHGDLPLAGFYRLADEHLAFNYPRRESRLACYSLDELSQAVSDLDHLSLLDASHADLGQALRQRDGGRKLWRLCLILALVALAAEAAIALRKQP